MTIHEKCSVGVTSNSTARTTYHKTLADCNSFDSCALLFVPLLRGVSRTPDNVSRYTAGLCIVALVLFTSCMKNCVTLSVHDLLSYNT